MTRQESLETSVQLENVGNEVHLRNDALPVVHACICHWLACMFDQSVHGMGRYSVRRLRSIRCFNVNRSQFAGKIVKDFKNIRKANGSQSRWTDVGFFGIDSRDGVHHKFGGEHWRRRSGREWPRGTRDGMKENGEGI